MTTQTHQDRVPFPAAVDELVHGAPAQSVLAPEVLPTVERGTGAGGLGLALVSAIAFASSGSFAKALLDAGWTSGAAVTARIAGAALALALPAAWSLRGRWRALADNWGTILAYGLVAVACSQLFYFNAVGHLSVGVALLLEYLSPVLLVGYLWARTRRAPAPATLLGSALALGGLALVVNLFGGLDVDPVGLGWGLAAACCSVGYFMIGARETRDLPPIALAWGGMVVASVVLGIAAALGAMPMAWSTQDVLLAGHPAPVWVPVAGLAVVAAAIAYGFGVAATRRLGSTVASFVALTEVIFAIALAWALLGELPTSGQLMGGILILCGVATVKFGDARA